MPHYVWWLVTLPLVVCSLAESVMAAVSLFVHLNGRQPNALLGFMGLALAVLLHRSEFR